MAFVIVAGLVAGAAPAAHAAVPAEPVVAADDAPPPPPPPPPPPLVTLSVPCTDDIRNLPFDNVQWILGSQGLLGVWTYYEVSYVWSSPTFDVSDSRTVTNDTDAAISATFSSQKSHTFTVEATAGIQAKLGNVITASVSSRFAWSWTTQIGVSVTSMVPPHKTLNADYGVNAYDLITAERIVTWTEDPNQLPWLRTDTCTEATGQVLRNIPTPDEGWRVWVRQPNPF